MIFYKLKQHDTEKTLEEKFQMPFSYISSFNEGVEISPFVTIAIPKAPKKVHRVRCGETIQSVLEDEGVTRQMLESINDLSFLFPGQILLIEK